MRRRLASILAPLTLLATMGGAVLTAPAAHAYGPLAQWQIGFSANCDNPKLCGQDGLGGFWSWAEFDTDNTADAQLTGCGHLQGPPIPGSTGAGHYSDEVDGWFIAPGITGLSSRWWMPPGLVPVWRPFRAPLSLLPRQRPATLRQHRNERSTEPRMEGTGSPQDRAGHRTAIRGTMSPG